MLYKEPVELVIQIETALLGQLVYYWEYYGKPCKVTLMKAKAEHLTGVRVCVDNPDAASFVFILTERLKVKLYNKQLKPIHINEI